MKFKLVKTTDAFDKPDETKVKADTVFVNETVTATGKTDGPFIEIELGQGPARWIRSDEVKAVDPSVRPKMDVAFFVRDCIIRERERNEIPETKPWFVAADFLIARALIETGISNAVSKPGSTAVGPLRVSREEWKRFLDQKESLASGLKDDDFDRWLTQIKGAAYRMFADAKAISVIKAPKDPDPKDKPFIPTYLDVFHAYLLNSPEAAVAVLDAESDEASKDKAVSDVLSGVLKKEQVEALLTEREGYLKTNGQSKSVKQFAEATQAELKKALADALKLIQRHAKDEIPRPPAAPNVIVVPADLKDVAQLPGRDPVPFAAFAPTVGELFWPVITSHPEVLVVSYQNRDGRIIGKPSRHFFADRSDGRRHHVGVDIYCSDGDDVVACADGTVVSYYPFYKTKTGEQSFALFIAHAGVVINYGEVKSGAPVHKEKVVKAGEKIGVVSSTDMIHFETYIPDTSANSPWLKGAQRPPRLLNPTTLLLGLAANATRILPNGKRVPGGGAQVETKAGVPVSVDKDDHLTLARTMYGEARSAKEPSAGREAVAHVVMNRVARKHMGDATISKVCLRDEQFSCWNPGDPNLKVIKDALPGLDPMFEECLEIAERVMKGQLADNTGGATHYYSETIAAPDWAKKPAVRSAKIGSHLFFTNVK